MPDSRGTRASAYDEFGMLHENAEEVGLPFDAAHPPPLSRVTVAAPSGNDLSALVWGEGAPEYVFLHGGAQNAHTWDTVALALATPMIAIDLPGHGHSAWRAEKDYRPQEMAVDVRHVIAELAPDASTLVGMSLGGLTALCTMAEQPDVADRLALVDVTPGVNQEKAEPILSFISGPDSFASFDEILERTMAYNPTRSRSSLRRGVLHNATEQPDGSWAWRYDLPIGERVDLETRFVDMWDAVSAIEGPLLLVQGGLSGVVDDSDIAELLRRKPDAEVVVVEEAGHSVQGDRPLELADLLRAFHQG
jgi:pimeloyl-ACP methyl ester carboxylesterase